MTKVSEKMKGLKKFALDMDMPLLIITIILFVFGLLNIVNASSQAVVIRYGTNLYNFFYKQLINLLIGSFAAIIILKVPTRKYYRLVPFVYIVILSLLVYLTLFGESYLGSVNWININGFKFQPSEFSKPVMIVSVSLLFERFCSRLRNNKKYTARDHYNMIGIIILIGILFPVFIFLQKDLGTMLILVSIFGILFLGSPIERQEKIYTLIFVFVVFCIACFIYIAKTGSLFTEEQKSRFDFIDPCSNYEEGGYQTCNGFIAINSGGLFGVGIGNSKQVSYLPESHTDSVFAIVAEEYGFLFCTVLFILYSIVLYRIFRLSSVTNTIRGKYICLGIGSYIALHIIINLGGLFGSMPLTGVPLPFLSYGGSYTISLVCSLAVVQRIAIEKNRQKIKIR